MKNYSFLIFLLVFLIDYSFAGNFTWSELKQKWSSPLYDKNSQKVLIVGSTITLVLVTNKKNLVYPVQKAASEDRPLGELAQFGDIMGMTVPNVFYMGGMYAHYKLQNDQISFIRSKYMFETTALTGITTIIFKRVFGQRRPNKGDHFSFPSGHTSTASAFATVVAMEHDWYWGLGAGAIAGIVGYSRINDNAHYLHDVVFGATLGMSFGIALKKFDKKKLKKITFTPLFFNEKNYVVNFTYHF